MSDREQKYKSRCEQLMASLPEAQRNAAPKKGADETHRMYARRLRRWVLSSGLEGMGISTGEEQ